MFARFVRLGVPTIELDQQGRCRPSLAALFNWRYTQLRNLASTSQTPEVHIHSHTHPSNGSQWLNSYGHMIINIHTCTHVGGVGAAHSFAISPPRRRPRHVVNMRVHTCSCIHTKHTHTHNNTTHTHTHTLACYTQLRSRPSTSQTLRHAFTRTYTCTHVSFLRNFYVTTYTRLHT